MVVVDSDSYKHALILVLKSIEKAIGSHTVEDESCEKVTQ